MKGIRKQMFSLLETWLIMINISVILCQKCRAQRQTLVGAVALAECSCTPSCAPAFCHISWVVKELQILNLAKTDISSLRTIWCMSQTSTLYSRGDILRYKNVSNSIKGLQILNHSLLEELSRQSNKELKTKTQRGTRAGRRKKKARGLSSGTEKELNPPSNLLRVPTQSNHHRHSNLPSIFYTNCRSLNNRKLAVLNADVELKAIFNLSHWNMDGPNQTTAFKYRWLWKLFGKP